MAKYPPEYWTQGVNYKIAHHHSPVTITTRNYVSHQKRLWFTSLWFAEFKNGVFFAQTFPSLCLASFWSEVSSIPQIVVGWIFRNKQPCMKSFENKSLIWRHYIPVWSKYLHSSFSLHTKILLVDVLKLGIRSSGNPRTRTRPIDSPIVYELWSGPRKKMISLSPRIRLLHCESGVRGGSWQEE